MLLASSRVFQQINCKRLDWLRHGLNPCNTMAPLHIVAPTWEFVVGAVWGADKNAWIKYTPSNWKHTLDHITWRSMVGRLLSFWGGISSALFVFGGVIDSHVPTISICSWLMKSIKRVLYLDLLGNTTDKSWNKQSTQITRIAALTVFPTSLKAHDSLIDLENLMYEILSWLHWFTISSVIFIPMLMGLMSIQEQKDRSPRWPVAGGPAQLVVTDLKSDRASFGAYEYHIMTSCNYSISFIPIPGEDLTGAAGNGHMCTVKCLWKGTLGRAPEGAVLKTCRVGQLNRVCFLHLCCIEIIVCLLLCKKDQKVLAVLLTSKQH